MLKFYFVYWRKRHIIFAARVSNSKQIKALNTLPKILFVVAREIQSNIIGILYSAFGFKD
jgi:hypothetical protein